MSVAGRGSFLGVVEYDVTNNGFGRGCSDDHVVANFEGSHCLVCCCSCWHFVVVCNH